MILKKHKVHVSYSTYVDVEVITKENATKEEILELASQKAAKNDSETIATLVANLEEYGKGIVESTDVFPSKKDAYNSLRGCLIRAGGYILINKESRPRFCIDDGENPQTHDIVVKSLFLGDDASSPIQLIDSNDERWDAGDYLDKEHYEFLWTIINNEI